jgi:hypothetical protein
MSDRHNDDFPWFVLDISRNLVLSAGYCFQDLIRWKELLSKARDGEYLVSPTWAGCRFSSRESARRILSVVNNRRIKETRVYFL